MKRRYHTTYAGVRAYVAAHPGCTKADLARHLTGRPDVTSQHCFPLIESSIRLGWIVCVKRKARCELYLPDTPIKDDLPNNIHLCKERVGWRKKYRVRVWLNGRRVNLGRFATLAEAVQARDDWRKEHGIVCRPAAGLHPPAKQQPKAPRIARIYRINNQYRVHVLYNEKRVYVGHFATRPEAVEAARAYLRRKGILGPALESVAVSP